jgi:phosphate transport system permease protein
MTLTAPGSSTDVPASRPAFVAISPIRKAKNSVASGLVYLAFAVAMVPLVWVIGTVLVKGLHVVLSTTWFTESLSGLLGRDKGGGAYHAIYGSLAQALVCAAVSVPIGIMVAIYLVEYGGKSGLAKTTTFMVDILTGVPSIVAALFIYAVWIAILGMPRSAFAVSLALVLLMIPVVVRTTEELLKIVPTDLREAAYALGVPKWRTILKVVIPTAMSGILTGVMLALARVMGETAPVLLLVAYAPFINFNLFSGNMASLPLLMYVERNNPTAAGTDRIWGAAVTLILIIALLNVLATGLSRFFAIKTK